MKLGMQAETILFFICFIFLQSISEVKPHNVRVERRVFRVRSNEMFGRETMPRAKDEGDNREGRLRSWAFRLQRGWAEALERNILCQDVGDPSGA